MFKFFENMCGCMNNTQPQSAIQEKYGMNFEIKIDTIENTCPDTQMDKKYDIQSSLKKEKQKIKKSFSVRFEGMDGKNEDQLEEIRILKNKQHKYKAQQKKLAEKNFPEFNPENDKPMEKSGGSAFSNKSKSKSKFSSTKSINIQEDDLIKQNGISTEQELLMLEQFEQESNNKKEEYIDSELLLLEQFEEEQKLQEKQQEQNQTKQNNNSDKKNNKNNKIDSVQNNNIETTDFQTEKSLASTNITNLKHKSFQTNIDSKKNLNEINIYNSNDQQQKQMQKCKKCKQILDNNNKENHQNNELCQNCSNNVKIDTQLKNSNSKETNTGITPQKIRPQNLTFHVQTPNIQKISFSITNDNISQSSNGYSMFSQESEKGGVDVIKMLKGTDFSKRQKIEEQIMTSLLNQKNQQQYYLEKKWAIQYTNWLAGKNQGNFGIFDNSSIIQLPEKVIKPGLKKNVEFVLVNELVYTILKELYGGGPELKMQQGDMINDITVEKITNIPKMLSLNKMELNPAGIENKANFCFMNSVLQCLLNIPEINYYFQNECYLKIKHKTKKNFRFCLAFSELVHSISNNPVQYPIVGAYAIKKLSKKQFDPSEQHDCQEFLRFILSELQDELNHLLPLKTPQDFPDSETAHTFYLKFNNSIIDQLFTGQLTSQIKCQHCKYISYAFDPFLDISLPINKNNNNLYECINSLFQEEELDENYLCEKCKQRSKARRSIYISRTPKVLVLHIKRFKLFPRKRKIKDFIQFETDNFEIKKYCKSNSGKTLYKLKSIACHSGTADCGHYVAFARYQKNSWKYFNDKSVKDVTQKQVESREAYLLFYERIE